jgi:hypothetical protein
LAVEHAIAVQGMARTRPTDRGEIANRQISEDTQRTEKAGTVHPGAAESQRNVRVVEVDVRADRLGKHSPADAGGDLRRRR